MKYLRKFNESVEELELDDILSVIDQMCLDIRDKDLLVKVSQYPRYEAMKRFTDLNRVKIYLDIKKDEETDYTFDLETIKSEFFDIVDFMKREGWQIYSSQILNRYGTNGVTIKDGKILDFKGDEIDYPARGLFVEFKKII